MLLRRMTIFTFISEDRKRMFKMKGVHGGVHHQDGPDPGAAFVPQERGYGEKESGCDL